MYEFDRNYFNVYILKMLEKHKRIAKDIIDLSHQYGADKASVSLANSTSFQVDVREKKIEGIEG